MAAITSQSSGAYTASDTAAWVGGVVPGDGDTVTITGTCQITAHDGWTIGTSPNDKTTIVLDIPSTSVTGARLIVPDGVTVNVKGNIRQSCTVTTGSTPNWGVDVQAGGTLNLDSSGAASQRLYAIYTGTANAQRCGVRINGTSNKRATVTAPSGSAWQLLTGSGGSNTHWIDIRWAQLTRMGTGEGTTDSGIYHAALPSGGYCIVEDTLFTSCGNRRFGSPGNSATIAFRRCVDTNAAVTGFSYQLPGGASVTAPREITDCVIRGRYQVDTHNANVSITGNVQIHGTPSVPVSTTLVTGFAASGKLAAWSNNVMYLHGGNTSGLTFVCGGDFSDNVLLRESTHVNTHWLNGGTAGTFNIERNYFEVVTSTFTGGNGDIWTTNGTTACTVNFRNNIVGRAGGGGGCGSWTLFGQNGTNSVFNIEHNTWFVVNAPGFLSILETTDGTCTNVFNSVKSNLLLSTASFTTAWKGERQTGKTGQDCVRETGWTHNNTFGLPTAAGSGTEGYGWNDLSNATNAMFTTAIPGAPGSTGPDTNHDPQCVGQTDTTLAGLTGTFLKWAQSIDPTITTAYDAVEKMAQEKAGTITQGFTRLAMWNYAKARYAPTNTALKDAGHDGVTIGAVEGVWPSTGSSGEEWYYRRRARRLRQQRRAA